MSKKEAEEQSSVKAYYQQKPQAKQKTAG